MACEVESEVESLLIIDSVIRGYHVYKDVLEKCCNIVLHVIHTTITILRPFGSGIKAEVSLSKPTET